MSAHPRQILGVSYGEVFGTTAMTITRSLTVALVFVLGVGGQYHTSGQRRQWSTQEYGPQLNIPDVGTHGLTIGLGDQVITIGLGEHWSPYSVGGSHRMTSGIGRHRIIDGGHRMTSDVSGRHRMTSGIGGLHRVITGPGDHRMTSGIGGLHRVIFGVGHHRTTPGGAGGRHRITSGIGGQKNHCPPMDTCTPTIDTREQCKNHSECVLGESCCLTQTCSTICRPTRDPSIVGVGRHRITSGAGGRHGHRITSRGNGGLHRVIFGGGRHRTTPRVDGRHGITSGGVDGRHRITSGGVGGRHRSTSGEGGGRHRSTSGEGGQKNYCPPMDTCTPTADTHEECKNHSECRIGESCCLTDTCSTLCQPTKTSPTHDPAQQLVCPRPHSRGRCPLRSIRHPDACASSRDCVERFNGGICCPDPCGSYCLPRQ